jgi:enamine deaminase RidA (YjgF/YER057c/UK114 family)
MWKCTNRRRFLRRGVFLATGAGAGAALLDARPNSGQTAADAAAPGRAEERLRQLGIKLPPAPKPVAVYVPAVRVGDILYVSGHGPRRENGQLVQGRVGSELSLEQGYAAARLVGLNVLSTVRRTLGSLNNVLRLAKVLGMVNCTTDFTQQPLVINGFSELMVEVFGQEAGKGARSAVGMNSLPSNIPVEIEAIFQVRT